MFLSTTLVVLEPKLVYLKLKLPSRNGEGLEFCEFHNNKDVTNANDGMGTSISPILSAIQINSWVLVIQYVFNPHVDRWEQFNLLVMMLDFKIMLVTIPTINNKYPKNGSKKSKEIIAHYQVLLKP